MLFALLAGFMLSFLAPVLHRLLGKLLVVPMVLFPLALFAYFCTQLPGVLAGNVLLQGYAWAPSLGINLQFRLDGLGLLFALLVSGFGALVMLYTKGYLGESPLLGRFYLYLTLFMTAMLGVVLSDNLFCLFIFWELTSITSFLLIGFDSDKEEARTSAWQALLVTGAGGLALMGGLILLNLATGSYTFSALLNGEKFMATHPLYLPATLLLLLACFTKSAQFPFHFWLPNAMAAPTPVSAYLHSATMVKAGIYLLARLGPVLGGTEVWQMVLLMVGTATTLLGALLALQYTDLKAVLAYTTISALGLMVSLTGIDTPLALKALLVFLLAHALYKGTLFMVVGAIDHSTGTRDAQMLRGLGPHLKLLAAAATLAGLSMAGILPFFGFVGKELLYEATLHSPRLTWWAFGGAFVSGLAFVAVASLLSYGIFWHKASVSTPVKHAPSFSLYLPPLLLGLLGLLLGLSPSSLAAPLLEQAFQVIASTTTELHLALWHGFTTIFVLSLVTVSLGVLLYFLLPRLQQLPITYQRLYQNGPNKLYHLTFKGFLKGAKAFTRRVQGGYLRNYMVTIVLFFCCLLVFVLWRDAPAIDLSQRVHLLQEVRLYELVLWVLVMAALLYLLNTRSRLTSIVVMGLVGYSAALFYILFGAPDVAATQLLIETLTVVIFVLLLHKLPAFTYLSHQYRKYKFVFVSVLFGSLMTYVLLLVQEHAVTSELQQFYGKASYLQAHGRNIVNVILVDFRGFDTLGEITVLAVAALGIFALLRLNPEKGGKR
ncbi:multisubunit sodium/proton antiporter MrpA subunit [Pontibacter ummariensis]|uniref:Multisubunit sodium/proton antiporter, MrpA subunit n=1 Tax=Pontibacter ummariensis TaxID=1610492 RepID=A0A239BW89_9BACT|nr:hydrogen gas-evolving membrane-bound hydrogenase subunit E [Pontibacter ummariensis]PRY15595.1 multisubunit sodium/proton antiporter MrpA subunit [Pontibacter ummariensis]SNS11922.1 multisubunit sodium/proton antiporter, MrpA subunit [Pontibacter ummariensis]